MNSGSSNARRASPHPTDSGTVSPLVEVLIPIWRRVLRQPSLGPEADFFEAGGHPALARELLVEIARVCGRDVSPVMICQAPTVAALASLLDRPKFRLSPVVLLKGGTQSPPVFIAHGVDGSMIDFFQLARQVSSSHPIYGMQAKGMDGADAPLQSIEAMAEFYLEAIRTVQPHGPYLFVGYSLGGLVMLEMAQRLTQCGEKINLLALVDSYPNINYLPLAQRVRLVARRAMRRLVAIRPGQNDESRVVRERAYEFSDEKASFGLSLADAAEQVRNKAHVALAGYRPRFYDGKIKFIQAAKRTRFPAEPAAVWGHLVASFELETVPGDHLSMITTHYQSVASILARFVEEAGSDRS